MLVMFLFCFLSGIVVVQSVDPSSVCYYESGGQVKYGPKRSFSITYQELFMEKIDLALMKSGSNLHFKKRGQFHQPTHWLHWHTAFGKKMLFNFTNKTEPNSILVHRI